MDDLYLPRINRVIDYVSENPESDLSLEALAKIAHFSPFHFHRVFKSAVGETLNQFVNRIRLERAADLMRADHKLRVIDAAIACGYESAEGFSRAFKRLYAISPGSWDRHIPLKVRKIGQVVGQFPSYSSEELRKAASRLPVEILARSEERLAYVRVFDAYNNWPRVVEAHDTLLAWYRSHASPTMPPRLYGMSQDDPDVTPLSLCRFDWCVAIPDEWPVPAPMGERRFPACRVAAIHARGDLVELDLVNQYLWRYWLPRSRYQPDNLPGMEIYRRLPDDIGWETYDMLCAIPVVEL